MNSEAIEVRFNKLPEHCVLSVDVRRLKFFRRGLWGGQAYGRQIGTGW
jgi:hypothetical protein